MSAACRAARFAGQKYFEIQWTHQALELGRVDKGNDFGVQNNVTVDWVIE